jgi:NDP-4-keto-2,6-dideoxyhexose 3-C-methyltransferase
MLATNAFDTICHEHIEYYALEQIERLVGRHGLRVFDIEKNGINGGSFLLGLCHAGSGIAESAALRRFRAEEKVLALRDPRTYADFMARVNARCAILRAYVTDEVAAGRSICIYGASTKGNTLLQYCGLDHRHIAAAADRNPEKWGRRTPLTGIPIISEDDARAMAPDYFLVLPWHFRDEFIRREADYLARGGRLIFPLPDFEVFAAQGGARARR